MKPGPRYIYLFVASWLKQPEPQLLRLKEVPLTEEMWDSWKAGTSAERREAY